MMRTLTITALLALSACATPGGSQVNNTAGRATVYEDPGTASQMMSGGVGIDSQDIQSMTDQMVRDMLSSPTLAGRKTPPRVIIDAENFRNESSDRINKDIITGRMQVELNRAAGGRMVFVDRESMAMVEKERALKRAGQVDAGTIRHTKATAGADFRLVGKIKSLDAVSKSTGTTSRYHQITFKMIDLEYGTLVWSGIYEFRKTGQDDVVYR